MKKIVPVQKITLGEQVATQLAARISAGDWKPGEKLPSEAQLCAALKVSRSTLRESLKSLAFVGMVRIQAGGGTFVAESSALLIDRLLARGMLKTEQDLADVWETRMVLETELAALAAVRATARDLKAIEKLLGRMTLAVQASDPCYHELDVEFHLALAAAAKNRVLYQLLTPIRGLLQEWIAKSQQLPGLVENAHRQHMKIWQGVRERDGEKARLAMRAHLKTFQQAWTLMGKVAGKQ